MPPSKGQCSFLEFNLGMLIFQNSTAPGNILLSLTFEPALEFFEGLRTPNPIILWEVGAAMATVWAGPVGQAVQALRGALVSSAPSVLLLLLLLIEVVFYQELQL